MTHRDCVQEETLTRLKDRCSSMSVRLVVLMGAISIFLFLVGFTASQSAKAKEQSMKTSSEMVKLQSRIDVQEERLKWILEGIQRIEKKLEGKKP